MDPDTPIKGRGTPRNPSNRFESTGYSPDPDPHPPTPDYENPNQKSEIQNQKSVPLTQYLPDHSHSIIATNTSPDIPFKASINPYRGCSHGCIYCFARPTHEYLGFSAGLDFETKIMVKHDAPALLRKHLNSPKWQPQTIAISGVTDCYQPAERDFQITRKLLEVLLDFRNPCGLITKNHLITRDLDLLAQLAKLNLVQVFISITTLDPKLTQIMEPRTSVPRDRLRTIKELSSAGIPVGVMAAPVIPALTDHELPKILEAAAEHGASSAGFVPLRLPFVLKDLFADWLSAHFPDRRQKILNRITDMQGGKLYDSTAFKRLTGEGLWADHISQTFNLHTARLNLNRRDYALTTAHFRRPAPPPEPLPLFNL